jgi:hypothetical protein
LCANPAVAREANTLTGTMLFVAATITRTSASAIRAAVASIFAAYSGGILKNSALSGLNSGP